MTRCVLTLSGLVWLLGLGLFAWVGLFAAVAVINRWIQGVQKEPHHV